MKFIRKKTKLIWILFFTVLFGCKMIPESESMRHAISEGKRLREISNLPDLDYHRRWYETPDKYTSRLSNEGLKKDLIYGIMEKKHNSEKALLLAKSIQQQEAIKRQLNRELSREKVLSSKREYELAELKKELSNERTMRKREVEVLENKLLKEKNKKRFLRNSFINNQHQNQRFYPNPNTKSATSVKFTDKQILKTLKKIFPDVKETTPIKGEPRRMGKSNYATIELIGDPQNVKSVTILIGIPANAPNILIQNTGICLILLKNTLPNHPECIDWFGDSIKKFSKGKSEREEKTIENAIIILSVRNDLSFITLTIKNKDLK